MTFEPYDYQAADLVTLRKEGYRGLLNMGTGSGKTALSLFSAREGSADRTLIIAPKQTLKTAWEPTVKAILGQDLRVIGNGLKAEKEAWFDFELGEPGTYFVTTELFTRANSELWGGDLLIVDEAHRLGRPGGKGQRKLGGYDRKDNPINQRFDGRLLLSGTVLRNRFEYAWSHSRTLWPEMNKRGEIAEDSFYSWRKSRMAMTEIVIGMDWLKCSEERFHMYPGEPKKRDSEGNPYVGTKKTAREFHGEIIPGEWISEAPCVITHLKREKCCEFHPNGYMPMNEPLVVRETVTLVPEQKKAIQELEKMMLTYLEDHPLEVKIPLTREVRIRQCTLGVPTLVPDEETGEYAVEYAPDCASPHYNRLKEILLEEVPDENVVVFTDSQKFAEVITQRLNNDGISAFEFSGKTTKTRDEDAKGFGTEYRVVVGVLQAIAEGFDGLQKVSKTEVWLSRHSDETINEQAEGRLDRIGQQGQVLRVHLQDDLGISEGKFGKAVEKRLELNRSLRRKATL